MSGVLFLSTVFTSSFFSLLNRYLLKQLWPSTSYLAMFPTCLPLDFANEIVRYACLPAVSWSHLCRNFLWSLSLACRLRSNRACFLLLSSKIDSWCGRLINSFQVSFVSFSSKASVQTGAMYSIWACRLFCLFSLLINAFGIPRLCISLAK